MYEMKTLLNVSRSEDDKKVLRWQGLCDYCLKRKQW